MGNPEKLAQKLTEEFDKLHDPTNKSHEDETDKPSKESDKILEADFEEIQKLNKQKVRMSKQKRKGYLRIKKLQTDEAQVLQESFEMNENYCDDHLTKEDEEVVSKSAFESIEEINSAEYLEAEKKHQTHLQELATNKSMPANLPDLGARSKTIISGSSGKPGSKAKKIQPAFERAKTEIQQNKRKSKTCNVM